jgi:lysophospholipase L1-like esterase
VNTIIEKFANDNDMIYLDYYSSMVDEDNALKKEYGSDGVHPNKEGYQVMSLLAQDAINSIFHH